MKALKISLGILGIGFFFGFLMPYLISLDNTLAVILGIFSTVLFTTTAIMYIIKLLITNKGVIDEKNV